MTLSQKLCMSQYHNDDALPKKSSCESTSLYSELLNHF